MTSPGGTGAADSARRYQALLDEILIEFPRFRLVRKGGSLLQRSIGVALAALTLGGQRAYLDGYVTTLGARVYVPDGWLERSPADRYVTMRHERVHLRQFRRYGLPLMALLYLLLPLPLGFAWFRRRLEEQAYEETLRAAAEVHGPAILCDAAFRERIVSQFTSAAYGWMWLRRADVERWYARAAAAAGSEAGTP